MILHPAGPYFRFHRPEWLYSSDEGMDPFAVDEAGLPVSAAPGHPFVHVIRPGTTLEVARVEDEFVWLRLPEPYSEEAPFSVDHGEFVDEGSITAVLEVVDRDTAIALFPGAFPGDDASPSVDAEPDATTEAPDEARPAVVKQISVVGEGGADDDGLLRDWAARMGVSGANRVELTARLERRRDGGGGAERISVVVDDSCIGFLTKWNGQRLRLPVDGSVSVPMELHTKSERSGARFEAFVLVDVDSPILMRTDGPRSLDDWRNQIARSRAVYEAGMIDGVHFIEVMREVKNLKRAGRLDEALSRCRAAAAAAERQALASEGADGWGGRCPDPNVTLELAIILRKLGRHDDEREALERWFEVAGGAPNPKLRERLDKVIARQEKRARPR